MVYFTAEDASNFLKALKPLDLQGIELDNADNVDWDEIRKYFDHQPGDYFQANYSYKYVC